MQAQCSIFLSDSHRLRSQLTGYVLRRTHGGILTDITQGLRQIKGTSSGKNIRYMMHRLACKKQLHAAHARCYARPPVAVGPGWSESARRYPM